MIIWSSTRARSRHQVVFSPGISCVGEHSDNSIHCNDNTLEGFSLKALIGNSIASKQGKI